MSFERLVSARRYSDRIVSPEITLEQVSPWLEIYGVTRLARITGLDRIGIPVWNAIRPNARSIVINQGKGLTDIDAKVSAAMEAVERAVAECPEVSIEKASVSALRARGRNFDRLDSLLSGDAHPLDEAAETSWILGRDLMRDASILVPAECVTLDRTKSSRYWQSSDGLASGNSSEEAVFHGLLERIERDADMLWRVGSFAHRTASCFDPAASHDPEVDRLLHVIQVAGFHITTFDITSDIGVPVVLALLSPQEISSPRKLRYIDVTLGSGAHPDAVRATIRAVTEAAQSRLTLISGARDDIPPEAYDLPAPASVLADVRLLPSKPPPTDAWFNGGTLREMTGGLLQTLRNHAINKVYAIPLSAPEAPFVVMKVLVPELDNPQGDRRQKLGGRALAKMLVF